MRWVMPATACLLILAVVMVLPNHIKGMGTSRALMIAAAIELGRRQNCHLKARIHTPGDALPFLKQYSIEQKEHFVAITLNGAHEIIKLITAIHTLHRVNTSAKNLQRVLIALYYVTFRSFYLCINM